MKQFIIVAGWLLMAVLLFVSIRSCSNEKQARKRAEKLYEQSIANGPSAPLIPVRTIRDTIFKTQRQKYRPTIIENDGDLSSGVSVQYIDSIERALDISSKKVSSLTKAVATLQATVQLLQQRDSVTGRLFAGFKDHAFDVKYFPDSNTLDITANVGLNFVDYKDRNNFLERWQYYTETFTTDPRFNINGLHRVIRKSKRSSRLGIDAYVGPAYTPGGFESIVVGVGIGFRVIEF